MREKFDSLRCAFAIYVVTSRTTYYEEGEIVGHSTQEEARQCKRYGTYLVASRQRDEALVCRQHARWMTDHPYDVPELMTPEVSA